MLINIMSSGNKTTIIIGASLSEPHIDELNVRNLYNIMCIYIIMYGTSVTRAPLYTLYAVRDIFRRPHEETSALYGIDHVHNHC